MYVDHPELHKSLHSCPTRRSSDLNNLIGYMKPISKEYLTPCKTPFIHGAAFMIKREVIDKVGLMPENYFLYYEELDWSERIKEKDYELWYEPNSLVLHKESQSTGNDSPLKTYYMVKNRLTFAKRNRNMILFCFSFLYQLSIALPKLILVNIKKNRNDLNKSALMGFLDFFKSK